MRKGVANALLPFPRHSHCALPRCRSSLPEQAVYSQTGVMRARIFSTLCSWSSDGHSSAYHFDRWRRPPTCCIRLTLGVPAGTGLAGLCLSAALPRDRIDRGWSCVLHRHPLKRPNHDLPRLLSDCCDFRAGLGHP